MNGSGDALGEEEVAGTVMDGAGDIDEGSGDGDRCGERGDDGETVPLALLCGDGSGLAGGGVVGFFFLMHFGAKLEGECAVWLLLLFKSMAFIPSMVPTEGGSGGGGVFGFENCLIKSSPRLVPTHSSRSVSSKSWKGMVGGRIVAEHFARG